MFVTRCVDSGIFVTCLFVPDKQESAKWSVSELNDILH